VGFRPENLEAHSVDELQPNGNPKNGANRIANEHITSQKLPPCEKSPTLSGVLWGVFRVEMTDSVPNSTRGLSGC